MMRGGLSKMGGATIYDEIKGQAAVLLHINIEVLKAQELYDLVLDGIEVIRRTGSDKYDVYLRFVK